MRFWILFLVLVLGSQASPVAADVASAHPEASGESLGGVVRLARQSDDLDCEDFESQEEAQAALDDDPADPNNLDPNQDGIACALLPSEEDRAAASADDVAAEQDSDTGNQTPEERRAARRAARQANEDAQATEEETPAVTCADFETAEDAQAAFDEDPEGLANLDADDNGIACEELLELEAEPAEDTQPDQERRRNRRNQDEEPAPTEIVIDEPETVRVREDFDCVDFEFQEEAQEVLDEDNSDPYNLDPSGDGVACSSLPTLSPRVVQVPRTGIGPSGDLNAGWLVAASVLSSLGAAAVSYHMRRRSETPCGKNHLQSQ
jgi:hypothetical protein